MSRLADEVPVPPAARARVLVPFALVTLVWGSTWLVIRGQLGMVSPTWSIAYRFALAAAAMAAYVAWTRAPWRIGRAGQGIAVAIGLCLFAVNFNFVYRAEQHVTSGLVALVFALLIVPNTLLAWRFLGDSVSRPFLIGSGVAIVGLALLFGHELRFSAAGSEATALGIGLTLAGVVAASIGNVLQASERGRALPTASLLAWAMLWGTLANVGLALVTVGAPTMDWSASYLAGLVYLGLVASAVAFTLYNRVIRTIGAGRAAYSSVLVPVIAMALSTVFEGYRWSLAAAIGAGLTLAGLLIALSARNPARKSG